MTPSVPPGTPVHTNWGWVTAFVPVAAVLLMIAQLWVISAFLLDYLRRIAYFVSVPGDSAGADPSQVSGLIASMMPFSIGSLLFIVLVWGLYAFGVVAAYFDYRELGRLGYPKRFHWAWGFIGTVYPIGRAVVVQRQAGAGRATMWIAIAAIAASVLISLIWSIWLMFAMLGEFAVLRATVA